MELAKHGGGAWGTLYVKKPSDAGPDAIHQALGMAKPDRTTEHWATINTAFAEMQPADVPPENWAIENVRFWG